MDLITRRLSHFSGLGILKVLKRQNTETQHTANRSLRLTQAQTAFRVDAALDPSRPYVIVDDVITTGSTIDQAARLLYEAGARCIFVLALARQPLD